MSNLSQSESAGRRRALCSDQPALDLVQWLLTPQPERLQTTGSGRKNHK